MPYEHKEGQGSLFKNEKQNDRQPDYKGTILIGGTTYEIAGWERVSKNGMNYLSLQASLPRERQAQIPAQPSYQQNYQQGPTGYQAPEPYPAPMPDYESYQDSDNIPEDLPF